MILKEERGESVSVLVGEFDELHANGAIGRERKARHGGGGDAIEERGGDFLARGGVHMCEGCHLEVEFAIEDG